MAGGRSAAGTFQRDPVSLLFTGGARSLLERAYAHPGQWQGTRIAAATPEQAARFLAEFGIDVNGRDQWGRDRWSAGFVRAMYYQHKWHRARGQWTESRRHAANDARGIRNELGRMLPARGVIPRGRAIRVVSKPGGAAALRAVGKMPDSRRIFDDAGAPAGRFAFPEERDW